MTEGLRLPVILSMRCLTYAAQKQLRPCPYFAVIILWALPALISACCEVSPDSRRDQDTERFFRGRSASTDRL